MREGQREREREGTRIPRRLHAASTEPNVGFEHANLHIVTWAEINSLMLSYLSHPDARPGSVSVTTPGRI